MSDDYGGYSGGSERRNKRRDKRKEKKKNPYRQGGGKRSMNIGTSK